MEGVAPLSFPRVASDQVSEQLVVSDLPRIEFIYLRVNDSAILTVAVESPQSAKSTEAFVRKAYTRAKSTLGG